jgi:SAM-dependent methyltransferase
MLHRAASGPPTVLADRSLRMLERGAERLGMNGQEPRHNVALLHADASGLPLDSGVFRSILSLNLLHVPCDAAAIVRELGRLLQPAHGRLFLSCLVRSGRWSDAYMSLLHRAGELREPWMLHDLERAATGSWGVVESSRVEGNMCYMVIRRSGATPAEQSSAP